MKITKSSSIGFIASGVILIALFCFILIFNIGNYVEVKSFTDSAEEVTAICKECFTHTEGDTKEYYVTAEYYTDSGEYTIEDLVVDRKYSAYEQFTLYVSADNPKDARLTLPESKFNTVSIIVLVPFTILGIMLILVGIKTLREPETSPSSNTSADTKTTAAAKTPKKTKTSSGTNTAKRNNTAANTKNSNKSKKKHTKSRRKEK